MTFREKASVRVIHSNWTNTWATLLRHSMCEYPSLHDGRCEVTRGFQQSRQLYCTAVLHLESLDISRITLFHASSPSAQSRVRQTMVSKSRHGAVPHQCHSLATPFTIIASFQPHPWEGLGQAIDKPPGEDFQE